VQVKPGGASIFAQPKSSGEIIGEYNAGVILNPTLRVFSNEGQIWLKIGDHWVPEASLQVIEGSQPPATPPTATAPPQSPPATPSPGSPPVGQSPPAPTEKTPQLVVITAQDPQIAINVRSEPNTESTALGAAKPGEQGEVLQQTLGKDTYTWYKLKFANTKTEGWVRGDFVKAQPTQSETKAAKGVKLVPQPKNPGSITAPSGVIVSLQTTPAQQTATPHRATSGQKVEILKMAKGEDGLAWYEVQLVDNVQAKGWVRGDQVRLLTSFTTPKPAQLSAPSGQVVDFYAEPSTERALSIRGVSGEKVEVLKQVKGDNGYAWYSIKIVDKPSAQGWIKGENLRLGL
jgi:uncharacterized protein YgiM (DUF1202 family)